MGKNKGLFFKNVEAHMSSNSGMTQMLFLDVFRSSIIERVHYYSKKVKDSGMKQRQHCEHCSNPTGRFLVHTGL